MGWEQQIGAGAGFLAVGLWRGYTTLKSRVADPNPTRSTASDGNGKPTFFRSRQKGLLNDLEYYVIIALSVCHVLANSIIAQKDYKGGYIVASAVAIERSGVASVFLLYGLVSLVREKTKLLPLPQEVLQLIAILAYGMEFSLFYLGDNHDHGIELHYQRLMLVPIGVCMLSAGLEIAYPLSVLLSLIHSMGLILQGTWLMQMALSLFTTKWMAQGCYLDLEGEADYTVKCEGMKLMRGRAIGTLQFNCHLATLLLVLLPIYSMLTRNSPAPMNYEPLGNGDLANGSGAMLELSMHNFNGQKFQGTYVLDDEESEEINVNVSPDVPVK